jgi:hypothetical protein
MTAKHEILTYIWDNFDDVEWKILGEVEDGN